MKTVAIIQAHMGSSRLPGKVLMDIVGEPMLKRVVDRVRRCSKIDQVVVATSILPADDAIHDLCEKFNVAVFRGSDEDVLDRFVGAARAFDAENCVRITSDCPLIDPEVSDHIVDSFVRANPGVDYASNKIPQSYPRGLDTEVFRMAVLQQAHEEAKKPYERVHVTPYIYSHPEIFKLLSVTDDVDRSGWRWTVDVREDMEFVRQVYDRLGEDGEFGWNDVVALLNADSTVHHVNQRVVQKPLEDG